MGKVISCVSDTVNHTVSNSNCGVARSKRTLRNLDVLDVSLNKQLVLVASNSLQIAYHMGAPCGLLVDRERQIGRKREVVTSG